MSNQTSVPTTWQTASLSDLLTSLETGSRPKGGVKGIGSGIPSLGGEHLESNGSFKFDNIRYVPEYFANSMTKGRIKPGDILVVKDGATTGKTSYVDSSFPYKQAVINEHIFLCRCSYQLNAKYVFYYMFSEAGNSEILEDFRGAAQGGISQRFADLVKVPVAPAKEQTRIVAKLEELLSDLDAGVAELKAAQKKLAQYRQSLLKAAVGGALTAEWREHNPPHENGAQLLDRILRERRQRWEAKQLAKFNEQGKTPPKGWQDKYPEPVQPDITGLPELPEGWVWASLDMLGEIASGVAKGTKRDASIAVREVPYLRVANVQRGYLDLSDVKTILATERDIQELTLESGDVLFNEGGDRDKLGRGWVWRDEVANCIHQNHVFRMRPYLKEMLPELISHHGNTFGKLWFQTAGKQTTNLASINMSMLRVFPVSVAPVDEQKQILLLLQETIDALDAQSVSLELGLKQAEAQRKNILKTAFSGQLVPQDPNDEPASLLLERIRAERALRDNQPKTRKTKKQKEIAAVAARLIDVLEQANDWLPAQEAFRLCGVADGAQTDQVEALYAELRTLDKAGRLTVEAVTDDKGRKLYDRLKLVVS